VNPLFEHVPGVRLREDFGGVGLLMDRHDSYVLTSSHRVRHWFGFGMLVEGFMIAMRPLNMHREKVCIYPRGCWPTGQNDSYSGHEHA
jgi:hypothetical protein